MFGKNGFLLKSESNCPLYPRPGQTKCPAAGLCSRPCYRFDVYPEPIDRRYLDDKGYISRCCQSTQKPLRRDPFPRCFRQADGTPCKAVLARPCRPRPRGVIYRRSLTQHSRAQRYYLLSCFLLTLGHAFLCCHREAAHPAFLSGGAD